MSTSTTSHPDPALDGPFTGVPFLVKDLAIEVAGTRFTEGSRWLVDNVSNHDQELAIRYATLPPCSTPSADPPSVTPTGCQHPATPLAEVGADPGRLRIAVSTRPRGGQLVDPAWSAAAQRAARLLEQLGHAVEEATPDGLDDEAYEPSLPTVYRGAGRLDGRLLVPQARPPSR